jgi:hypothetical protein
MGVTLVLLNHKEQPFSPGSLRSALTAAQHLHTQAVAAEVLVLDCASRNGSLTLLRQLEALYFEVGLRLLALPQPVSKMDAWNLALVKAAYRTILFIDTAHPFTPDDLYSCYQAMQAEMAAAAYIQEVNAPRLTLFDRLQLFDSGGFPESTTGSDEDIEMIFAYLSACGRQLVAVHPGASHLNPATAY